MHSLGGICTFGLILSMMLTSCAPSLAPLAAASPSAEPKSTPPAAKPAPTDEPFSVAVPAIEYSGNSSQLGVVSSATGKAFDSLAPIPLGTYFNYAFSPDRHTLAMVSDSTLDLIDLRTWRYRASDVNVHGWLSAITYSSDGRLLALATGYSSSELRIVDAYSGKLTASAATDFSVRSVRFTTDEKALMVYGARVQGDGVSTGAPAAALFAVSDLARLWSVDLKSVRDGIFPKDPRAPDIYQPGAATSYAPAVAFASNNDSLYVVHGDEDRLTTVDFKARRARTIPIQAKLSWLDRLMELTAGVAYAKGMDGTMKQGVISPDGKYLYVTATTETYVRDSSGNGTMTVSYGGLEMIALQDGTLLRHIDTQASSLSMSPDGGTLYLTGWGDTSTPGPWSEIYDVASNRIVKHMDSLQLVPSRRLDGTPVLLSTDYISGNWCQQASIDPATWKITSSWQGVCIDWLIDP